MNTINRQKTSLSPNVWHEVKADIEHKILTGTFAAGERIPPIRKLANDYGIGQSTAQKILNSLYQEGILEAKRGIGFFVKPYIREQLLSERKKRLEETVIAVVDEASIIDVDLLSVVEKYLRIKENANRGY